MARVKGSIKTAANTPEKGFTLVELSVVIVIIGLIVAGVVGGQSLVNQAQLRDIVSSIAKYKVAHNSFRTQYAAFAGDLSNANSYWAAAADGNGNGRIGNDGAYPGDDYFGEPLQFWNHMALAGLLKEVLDPNDAGTPDFQPGINVPATNFHDGMYVASFWGIGFPIFNTNGNVIVVASAAATGYWEGMFTAREGFSLDKKMDDGRPATGFIYVDAGNASVPAGTFCGTQRWDWTPTVGSQVHANVDFVLTDTTRSCRLWVWLDKGS